jgi:hypothetical protein
MWIIWKLMGQNESNAERKIHSSEYLQKETRERAYNAWKLLNKRQQITPKRSKQQEIIKIWAEINQVKTKRTTQRINKTSSWFFKKLNKIDKLLARLTRGPRDSIQINKIRNEKGAITTETGNLKKILLQKPIFNTIGKSGWKWQFSRQIPNTKFKLASDKPSKQSHNP